MQVQDEMEWSGLIDGDRIMVRGTSRGRGAGPGRRGAMWPGWQWREGTRWPRSAPSAAPTSSLAGFRIGRRRSHVPRRDGTRDSKIVSLA
jgi:hypothetical protein